MSMQEEMHKTVDGIITSHEARAAKLASLRQDSRRMLSDIGATRQAASREQKANLGRGRADLAQNFRSWLKEIAAAFHSIAEQQHADLTKSEAGRKAGVSQWLTDIAGNFRAMAEQQRIDLAKADAGMKSDVNALIREIASGRAGSRKVWRDMAASLAPKTGGAASGNGERPHGKGISPAAGQSRAAEAEPHNGLSKRLVQYLSGRAGGARLVEMEKDFGINRFQMNKAIRKLMSDRKIQKSGLLYSAVQG